MKILDKLMSRRKDVFDGGALVLFETTHEAMKADRVLRDAGMQVRLVAPPMALRQGCDLAVEFNLYERLFLERIIDRSSIDYIAIQELDENMPKPISLVDITEFGDFVMVRAGNMKITAHRHSGEIVNISGGGCPDVPFLYREMVGKTLNRAPMPRDLGYTLCALMLDRAYEECRSLIGVN
jgi:hypothetical protein